MTNNPFQCLSAQALITASSVDEVKCLFVVYKDETSNFVIVKNKQNLIHKPYPCRFSRSISSKARLEIVK